MSHSDSEPPSTPQTTATPEAVPPSHDPQCPQRLLLIERDFLVPLLRRAPRAWFARPTSCPGWTVRDLLAHCAAALTRIAADRLHDFTPEDNQSDVLDRKDCSIEEIVDELEAGCADAGPAIAAADGRLDVIALGEWVHAGDVRAAFEITPSYAAEGTEDALALLTTCSRLRETPLLTAHLPDRELRLGIWLPDQREHARLTTDADTLVRLYTGRPADEGRYSLTGAAPADLVIYR